MYGLANFIKGKNCPCKSSEISAVVFFLICQVICYSVIEESAHVIGKSQSTREEGARTDEEGERWWRGRGEKEEVVRIN